MKLKKEKRAQCPNCTFSLSGSEKFCPECGDKLPLSGSKCGATLGENKKFCFDCGTNRLSKLDPIPSLSSKAIDFNYFRKESGKSEPSTIPDPNDSTLEWYIGPDRDISWYEAIEWLNNLLLDDGEGWRMPMRRELRGLYDNSVSSNCKIKPSFSSWLWVWSGEKRNDPYPNAPQTAWGFDFRRGIEFWGTCTDSLRSRVFVVRRVLPNKGT